MERYRFVQPTLHFIRDFGREENLYYSWIDQKGKILKMGNSWIRVIHPGYLNRSSGPDFKHAQLQIAGHKIITGDIEIHWNSENWEKHGHTGDPEYTDVILHVAYTGKELDVHLNETDTVPTILLFHNSGQQIVQPCIDLIQAVSTDTIISSVKLYSMDRYAELQNILNLNDDSIINTLFNLLDTRGNSQQIQKIIYRFLEYKSKGLPVIYIINSLITFSSELPWKMGRKRPRSHPKFRLPYLTYLANLWYGNTEKFYLYTPEQANEDVKALSQLEYSVPGRHFISEIFGNVIFPAQEKFTGSSKFNNWFELPVQLYSVTKKRLACWNIDCKISYGLQQGILKLEKELCQSMGCDLCPINIHSTNHCLA